MTLLCKIGYSRRKTSTQQADTPLFFSCDQHHQVFRKLLHISDNVYFSVICLVFLYSFVSSFILYPLYFISFVRSIFTFLCFVSVPPAFFACSFLFLRILYFLGPFFYFLLFLFPLVSHYLETDG